jgi:hypothetical protein
LVYLGIKVDSEGAHFGLLNGKADLIPGVVKDPAEAVKDLGQFFPPESRHRVVAAGIYGDGVSQERLEQVGGPLWRDDNIVPVYFDGEAAADLDPAAVAKRTSSMFDSVDGRPLSRIDRVGRVHPDKIVPLSFYRESDPVSTAIAEYFGERDKQKGLTVFNVSATARGGGVNKIEQREVAAMQAMGLKVFWLVQDTSDPSRYAVTKDIHRTGQNVPGDTFEGLTKGKLDSVAEWGDGDFGKWEQEMGDTFLDADVYVFHDNQPVTAGLMERIHQLNERDRLAGTGKHRIIVFRQHTQWDGEAASTLGTKQYETWQLLWGRGIQYADITIAHPLLDTIPDTIPPEKVLLNGASTDRWDGLNNKLRGEVVEEFRERINDILPQQIVEYKAPDGKIIRRLDARQDEFDWSRKYALEYTRWDEAKCKGGVLDHWREYVKNEKAKGTPDRGIVSLIMAGDEATDDPSMAKEFMSVWDKLQSQEYDDIRPYVRLFVAPPNDFYANTLMSGMEAYILNSTREGYEISDREALIHRKPTLSTLFGGPKLQLEPVVVSKTGELLDTRDKDSFLISPDDPVQAGMYLSMMFDPQDRTLYDSMADAAARHGKTEKDTTMQTVACDLYLYDALTDARASGTPLVGNRRMLMQLAGERYAEAMRLQGAPDRAQEVYTLPMTVFAASSFSPEVTRQPVVS